MLEISEGRMLTQVTIKGVRNLLAGRPRVPGQRESGKGESAPKARLKGVVDGKRVNIPALTVIAMRGRRRLSGPGVGSPGERK